ncbi:hypothetical protein [Burkholderia dolosa]|uniref:hypothetical protein n=1 Tax=Burkholderia dolosa TaxID=152500 RepID=UPI001BA3AC3F|nr:hypothetical protein [Burkholderia dolosa]MBR8059045.1 hypothetical protein [Burkholderia dolosa]
MRILLNRKARMRDTLRGVLALRADARRAAGTHCPQCGFTAFHALERCPACGLRNRRFEPPRMQPDDAYDVPPVHPLDAWSSRIARAVRDAALRRPRASSAPLLSILTLVLLVGGYVTADRVCKADPVCRGPDAPDAAATGRELHAADGPTLPVVPVPVYPFRAVDTKQAAAERNGGPDANARTADRNARAEAVSARNAPTARAPEKSRAGSVRVADWKGGRDQARHTRAVRRVSAHVGHGRRAASSDAELAKIYRGH